MCEQRNPVREARTLSNRISPFGFIKEVGMYIFDESGIYATAEGSVYDLDHDANVIATILN